MNITHQDRPIPHLYTDMTGVPLSPVDDYYKELGKRMMGEAKVKEAAQKAIGDTSFVKLKDNAIQIVTKNGCIELYPDEIKELSAFIKPEKEVSVSFTDDDETIVNGKIISEKEAVELALKIMNHYYTDYAD